MNEFYKLNYPFFIFDMIMIKKIYKFTANIINKKINE